MPYFWSCASPNEILKGKQFIVWEANNFLLPATEVYFEQLEANTLQKSICLNSKNPALTKNGKKLKKSESFFPQPKSHHDGFRTSWEKLLFSHPLLVQVQVLFMKSILSNLIRRTSLISCILHEKSTTSTETRVNPPLDSIRLTSL